MNGWADDHMCSSPPTRAELIGRIAREVLAIDRGRVLRAGIDGADGAGKTTFASELADALAVGGRQVIRISADDFLNPRSVRHLQGRDSPQGFFEDSYDYEALRRCVLHPLAPGGSRRFRRRAFDVDADRPCMVDEETADQDAVLVLDGLFLHRPELAQIWDYSIFLDVDSEVSVARCATRGTPWASPDVDAPSNRRYVLGQRLYLERCAPQRLATRVIDNNDLSAPRLIR